MLRSFLTAVPTAELEPITENYVQADEVSSFLSSSSLRTRADETRFPLFPSFSLFRSLDPGRHGNVLQRAIHLRSTEEDPKVWSLQHVRQVDPGMGWCAFACRGRFAFVSFGPTRLVSFPYLALFSV